MARWRGSKYLTCFYCGKRSSTKYDGVTREFLCLTCEATNYLDQNGDITDPPVATDQEAESKQYVAHRPASPTADAEPNAIFCATCIKNQRLFTASLAQYLPDDPSHPDYPELERNYYRYRRGLERRYPQVCEDCAEKVDSRIRQAGYTAKTDHLRRMMEKTRGRKTTRFSFLDFASALGRSWWAAGWLCQMLWHLTVVSIALQHAKGGMRDPDDKSVFAVMEQAVASLVSRLPSPEQQMRFSIAMSTLAVWWNPHFVQVFRGFSRHLLGLTHWYSFQGLIIFFRFVLRRALQAGAGQGLSTNAQVTAHVAMAAMTCFMYSLAWRSIRVDTTPLFGPSDAASPPRRKPRAQRKVEDPATLSNLLDDALGSPSSPQQQQRNSTKSHQVQPLPPPQPRPNPVQTPATAALQFGGLGLSDPRPEQQYSDEMDWAPTQSQTQSQHRAFSDQPRAGTANRPFSQAPTQPDAGAFWYKVPPAPANPAQRLRNPPQQPSIRSKPVEDSSLLFQKQQPKQHDKRGANRSVPFKDPTFFAPEDNEDANSLADLLGKSFSLSQDQAQEGEPADKDLARRAHGSAGAAETSTMARLGRGALVAAVLALWVLSARFAIPYMVEIRVASLSVVGLIAFSTMGPQEGQLSSTGESTRAAYVSSLLAVLELAALCWIGFETWASRTDVYTYSVTALTVMLGHHVWIAAAS